MLALVTGANKGIGLEIARQLKEAGLTVIIGVRDLKRGEAALAELGSLGVPLDVVRIDVQDEGSIAEAADQIAARHGRLDILSTMPASSMPLTGLRAGLRPLPSAGSWRRTLSAPWPSPRRCCRCCASRTPDGS